MTTGKPLTTAEKVAETCGAVLGAASQSGDVTEERLNSIAEKVMDAVLASANDPADATAAGERFAAAVEAGRCAAEDGEVDLDAATSALTAIERQLSV